MKTCTEHWNDCVVVYDRKNCPLCQSEDEIQNLEMNVRDLENKVESLEESLNKQDE